MRLAALACLLLLCSCNTLSRNTVEPVGAQKGGYATGAGATVVQPVNSSGPTTQKATREIWYAPPQKQEQPVPTVEFKQPWNEPATVNSEPPVIPVVEVTAPQPHPLHVIETNETLLGAHQDLAGIIETVGKAIGKNSMLLWFGILAIIGGVAGLMLSYRNDEGYPLVYILTVVVGITWIMVPPSNFWLILAIIPIGFFAVQKLGLWKMPV